MKYELDCKSDINDSLLFWIEKYMVYKLITLSRRHIDDINDLNDIIQEIKNGTKSIKELHVLIKKARKIGIISMHTYFNPLEKLFQYIKENNKNMKFLKMIDEEYLVEYLLDITSKAANATKKNYRAILIDFFKYIDKQNLTDGIKYHFDIDLKSISWIKNSNKKLPIYLDDDNLSIFFQAIRDYESSSEKCLYRNATIIYTILNTGLRASEVLNIKVKDITTVGSFHMIEVIGKGNKERKVLLQSEILDKYLTTIDTSSNENLIFPNLKNKALHQSYLHRQIMYILNMGNIKVAKKGAHLLRHTFATRLYQQTKDLVLVQEVMGHSDINTTRIYTHFNNNKLEASVGIMDEFN